jgi:hypothetical protein
MAKDARFPHSPDQTAGVRGYHATEGMCCH